MHTAKTASRLLSTFAVAGLIAAGPLRPPQARAEALRPPASPLVTFDPYLSVWSEADHLTDDVPRHWTHRPHSLASLIRVDGATQRLMGNRPLDVPAMPQVGKLPMR